MEPVTFQISPGLTAIDTFYGGRERYTAAYLLTADEPAIVETGPTTSAHHVVAGLESLGIGPADLAHIVVTHIHLDHAGGVGRLTRVFPNATIWVHERGAPHLQDPARLVASATRLYGEATMASLFGPVDPVPSDRIRPLADGDRIELGGRSLEALDTPGHASHHVALVDSATGAVFTGDVLGIHVPDVRALRPATPPPDFDPDLTVRSIERIRGRARSSMVLFSHFGPVAEVDRICDLAVRRTWGWTEVVRRGLERTDDLDEIVALLEAEARRDVETGAQAVIDLERFETLSSIRMNAMGIVRYWRKLAEREATDRPAPQPES
ncbi:MAG TPA: MBL fold metallo-hydrolase [Actinomycetota bacterium]|nr:MBL fold metallo-hydrolase [Actinomycetota bacterium]